MGGRHTATSYQSSHRHAAEPRSARHCLTVHHRPYCNRPKTRFSIVRLRGSEHAPPVDDAPTLEPASRHRRGR
eukprot:6031339-Prymnesium_polylepis.1